MAESLRWLDSHVHLDRYGDADREAMLERAAAAGVEVLAVSTGRASSERTVALRGIWKAVGVHPTRAGTADDIAEWLSPLAGQPGVVAVGECGFDDIGPAGTVQRAVFAAQCGVARQFDRALILHIDGTLAWREVTDADSVLAGLRVVRHYFTGDTEQAAWHAERGHWLSFGRPLLREARLQEVAASYPAELLLIETDTYPLPGRTTEPKDVIEVGGLMARLRGWDAEACAERLGQNAGAAFRFGMGAP